MFRKIELEGKIYYIELEQFSYFFKAVTDGDFEEMLKIASVVLQINKGFDIVIKNNQIPLFFKYHSMVQRSSHGSGTIFFGTFCFCP